MLAIETVGRGSTVSYVGLISPGVQLWKKNVLFWYTKISHCNTPWDVGGQFDQHFKTECGEAWRTRDVQYLTAADRADVWPQHDSWLLSLHSRSQLREVFKHWWCSCKEPTFDASCTVYVDLCCTNINNGSVPLKGSSSLLKRMSSFCLLSIHCSIQGFCWVLGRGQETQAVRQVGHKVTVDLNRLT